MTKNDQKLVQVLLVICAGLLIWNVALTKKVSELAENPAPITDTTPGVTQGNTSIKSDVTEVAKEVQDKVVSVLNVTKGSSGSGVVYKKEGNKLFIVSNHHVVENSNDLVVKLSSGEEIKATLIGSDVYSDLALLSIEGSYDIKPFVIGNSETATVGEFVIAVGSPLGAEFANSVTFGILSGKNRIIPVDTTGNGQSDWDMVVHQTDAAINPGNSGGALVNMAGELIGINSLKFSSSNVEGMGFAIPTNEMLPIIQQIEATGSVRYPQIGVSTVSIQDLSVYQRAYYKVPDSVSSGLFVAEVTKQGPAAKGGLKSGDVIVKFEGETIKQFSEFRRSLYKKQVGQRITLGIMRNGQAMDIEVTLE